MKLSFSCSIIDAQAVVFGDCWNFLPNLFIAFFSRVSQSSSVVFYVFSFWFEFFKSTRVLPNLIYNICEIFMNFFPISSSLSSSWIKLFRPETECSFSDSLLVPKILFARQFTVIMGRHPVIIFMFWFITTGPFLEFFPLISLTSRGININFLFSLSLPYLLLKVIFWIWWQFRACSPIITLSIFPKLLPSSFCSGSLEGRFSTILPVRFSNLNINVSAKSWKLLLRHVCKSGYSWCFWLEHAFSLKKCVGGSGCNTGKSPEGISFSAFTMLKRSNNNN